MVIITGGVAALVELVVVRRLKRAPRLMTVVATLGVAQFLVSLAGALNTQAGAGATYPVPSFLPTFHVGVLKVTTDYSAMLFFSPLVVIALALFLKRSRYGLAMRGAAANPDVARRSGIFAGRMSTLAWALAGALSGFTAILTQPSQGFSGSGTFGPSLLLRALAAAVLARMSNLGGAVLAGVAFGVMEQLILWNYNDPGLITIVLLVVILVGLIVQRPRGGREEEKGSWAAVQAIRPLPEALNRLWLVRNLGRVVGFATLAFAFALPLFITNSSAVTITGMIAFAVVGLSVGLVTGLAGQLTLGQFALAAVGGVISIYVLRHSDNLFLAFVYGGIGAALTSLLVGLPALRIKGLMLTVTTLAFALAVSGWLLSQPWMLGIGRSVRTPVLFGHVLSGGKGYYVFALAVLTIMVWLTWNIRRGGFGRLLVGIRDNEDAARSFTVSATAAKTQAFLLSGFVAGVGGALYATSLSFAVATSFPVEVSISVVVMTVIGGVSLLAGPILGVLLVVGIPAFVPLDAAGLAATQFGLLLIIMYLPSGIGGLVEPLRDRIAAFLGRRAGIDVDVTQGERAVPPADAAVARAAIMVPAGSNGARARNLSTAVLRWRICSPSGRWKMDGAAAATSCSVRPR